jgi:hypothetical protein
MGDNLKRYIVSFESFDGKRTSYSVLVRNGRDKAIALAAAQYTNSHLERDPSASLSKSWGRRNPDGTPMMDGDELVDSYEW